jgi:hypothetical protein
MSRGALQTGSAFISNKATSVGVAATDIRYWPLPESAADAELGPSRAASYVNSAFMALRAIGPAPTKAKNCTRDARDRRAHLRSTPQNTA